MLPTRCLRNIFGWSIIVCPGSFKRKRKISAVQSWCTEKKNENYRFYLYCTISRSLYLLALNAINWCYTRYASPLVHTFTTCTISFVTGIVFRFEWAVFLLTTSSCGLKPIFNANDTSKTRNTGIILLKSIMGGGRRYLKKVGASKKMVIIREILI